MTALLLVFLVVIVLGAVLSWVRRARAGHRFVQSHHRALDTLGQIATSRVDSKTPVMSGDEDRSHVKVVGDQTLSRPTPPRVPRQLRAGRRPTRPVSLPSSPWPAPRPGEAAPRPGEAAREAATNGSLHQPPDTGDDPDQAAEPARTAVDRLSFEERRNRSPWRRGARVERAAEEEKPTENAVGAGDGKVTEDRTPAEQTEAAENGHVAEQTEAAENGDVPEQTEPAENGKVAEDRNGERPAGGDGQTPTLEPLVVPVSPDTQHPPAATFEAPSARASLPRSADDDLTVFPAQAPPPGQAGPAVDDWVHKALGWTDDGIDDWWPVRDEGPPAPGSEDPTQSLAITGGDTAGGSDAASSEFGEDVWNQADDVWTEPSEESEDGEASPSGRRALRRSLEQRSRTELVALGSVVAVAVAALAVILIARGPTGTSAAHHGSPPANAVQSKHAKSPKTTTTTAPPPVKLVSSNGAVYVYQLQSPSASIALTSTQTGRSWVVARHGSDSGALAFEGLFQNGERRSFQGPFWFDLSVPKSVMITVNGTAIAPSAGTRPIEVQFNAPTP